MPINAALFDDQAAEDSAPAPVPPIALRHQLTTETISRYASRSVYALSRLLSYEDISTDLVGDYKPCSSIDGSTEPTLSTLAEVLSRAADEYRLAKSNGHLAACSICNPAFINVSCPP